MKKNLLIIGAGQYGKVAKEIAEDVGTFEKIDFLDDNSPFAIGKISDMEKFSDKYQYAFVALGDVELRLKLIEKLEEACYRIAILVSPKAYVSPSAQILKGTIVEPMAAVHTDACVSVGCIVSAGAVINHNVFVGDGCHINCNATIDAGRIMLAKTKLEAGKVF